MSAFWSWFIIVLVVINIVGSAWLLWWTSRKRGSGDTASSTETTGHVWDGDLTEYNKPLPKWWINLFWITIFFGIAYLVWYPGMGSFEGKGEWTSAKQHDADKAAADARILDAFGSFADQPIDAIARDPQALAFGGRLFADYCSQCHGSDARGAKGYPNLTDDDWLWGGKPDDILATVLHGRQAAMPPMGAVMGSEAAITEVAAYVQSLSGQKADPALVAAGQARFAGVCAACHGVDGKGNPQLGAPDLSDDTWLYGSDFTSIRETIVLGRNGQMPAHAPILGELRSRLAAAYVWSLTHPPGSKE
ncbi:MAG TPA: cytochrome-c oxidase, cbb3-type subunit III [Arenimonas sp.]|nr:cytochrome-c oxidase, cbb3-type subunit III [Arenimonas sp.]